MPTSNQSVESLDFALFRLRSAFLPHRFAMGAPRRKDIITSRRRVEDDGEEEGSVVAGIEDDSLSEGSAISDADDDADAEGSDLSETGTSRRRHMKSKDDPNARLEGTNGFMDETPSLAKQPSFSARMADTETMMNGMKTTGDVKDAEEISFDDISKQIDKSLGQHDRSQSGMAATRAETLVERRKREHEEYKKKMDADPAFVPNRGGFFMHDHRSAVSGQNGFRPSIRGRGRGRGAVGGSFQPAMYFTSQSDGARQFLSTCLHLRSQNSSAPGPVDSPWAHDLHETVAQPEAIESEAISAKLHTGVGLPLRPAYPSIRTPPPNRSFSKSTRIGNQQIRVYLAGMQDPIVFSAVPVNQHTRLPHHRPPLRRDKPVRISIPDFPPRYIFPAMDRSFIFIPRALRPNQQGFGRGRGRGSFSTYGGLPSRRTSTYGGSNYSPSAAMSRRSSLVRATSREGIISPVGSTISRSQGKILEVGKPVVRLPPSVDQGQNAPQVPPQPDDVNTIVNLPPPQLYSLPQNPLSRENRPMALPMHQPRPQKTVSVADIESPATLNFHPPQQQLQQPFHQQVPLQANGQVYPSDSMLYPHSRHPSHPSQASGGTPLSQIPERAIHAPPFQPYPYQQPAPFFPQQYPPPVYYYPPPVPTMPPSITAPTFIPGQQYPYVVSSAPIPTPPEIRSQSGTVAHESNGMVYYYDSSQLAANVEAPAPFPPPGYDQSSGYIYPQATVYYASQ